MLVMSHHHTAVQLASCSILQDQRQRSFCLRSSMNSNDLNCLKYSLNFIVFVKINHKRTTSIAWSNLLLCATAFPTLYLDFVPYTVELRHIPVCSTIDRDGLTPLQMAVASRDMDLGNDTLWSVIDVNSSSSSSPSNGGYSSSSSTNQLCCSINQSINQSINTHTHVYMSHICPLCRKTNQRRIHKHIHSLESGGASSKLQARMLTHPR